MILRIKDLHPLNENDPFTLELLGIINCGFTNTDIPIVAGLTHLYVLGLMAEENLTNISALSTLNLQIAAFAYCPITDLSVAANWPDLTMAFMDGISISDLDAFAGLEDLQNASFNQCAITDLSGLEYHTSIQSLGLSQNLINDDNTGPLATLTGLQNLQLADNEFTNLNALIENTGLGGEDRCDIRDTPLSQDSVCFELPDLREKFTNPNNVQSNAICIPSALTISIYGNGYTTPSAGTHSYLPRTKVNLSAWTAENSGWVFDHWEGDIESFNPETSIVMNGDKSVAAVFRPTASFLFGEDFEATQQFTFSGGLWAVTPYCEAWEEGHSAAHALYYGEDLWCDYAAGNTSGTATSPFINLHNVTAPVYMSFNYFLETEGAAALGFDMATIEVSSDGGPFSVIADNDPVSQVSPLVDPTSGWRPGYLNLSSYAGSYLQIRFAFNTGDAQFNDFPGFYVDDIKVYDSVGTTGGTEGEGGGEGESEGVSEGEAEGSSAEGEIEGETGEGEGGVEGEGEGSTAEGETEGGGEGESEGEGEAPCDTTMVGLCGATLTAVQPGGTESGTAEIYITMDAYERMTGIAVKLVHTVASPAGAFIKSGETVVVDLGIPSSPINHICTTAEVEALMHSEYVYFEITSGNPPVSIITGAPDCDGPDSIILSSPLLVDKNNTSEIKNGLCWETAFTEIQSAIDMAAERGGHQVWVAKGTYNELRDNSGALRVKSNVEVFGGFDGTETTLEERDWTRNLTIIDGHASNNGEPASHVVLGENLHNARLDGFVIACGGNDRQLSGAQGGGLYLSNTDETVVLSHLTFTVNMSGQGGGVYLTHASPLIRDSRFVTNIGLEGGGMYLDHSSPRLENVLFLGNAAVDFEEGPKDGGALYTANGSYPELVNSTAIVQWSRDAAIHVDAGQNTGPVLTNCAMWYNTPKDVVGNVSASYTISQDDLTGTGNLHRSPLFALGIMSTFTADATYDEDSNRTIFHDSTQNFTPGALVGSIVQLEPGIQGLEGFPLHVVVLDNTATSFEVALDIHDQGDRGHWYRFLDGGVVASSPAIDAGTSTNAPSLDFSGQERGYDGDRQGKITGDFSDYDIGYLEYRGGSGGYWNFGNSSLETAVLGTLPYLGGPVEIDDITPITELDLSWWDIERLDGIEYFVNLRVLNLSGNPIQNLAPIASLVNLEELDLSYCGLTDITPLKYLTNLKKLKLHYNHISDLSPLAGLTKLQYLDIGFGNPLEGGDVDFQITGTNNIEDIEPLAALSQLEYINMGGNTGLTEISTLSGMTSLETVWLASNPIASFEPIEDLLHLNTLGIIDCGFVTSDVPYVAPLTGIEAMAIMNNEDLSDISGLYRGGEGEGESLPSMDLKIAAFANCPIEDFSVAAHWSSLYMAQMDGTEVSDLDGLAELEHLDQVSFQQSALSDISGLAYRTSIRSLNLGQNQIGDANTPVLATLTGLEELSLEDNQLTDIQALVNNPGLGGNDYCTIMNNPIADCDQIDALRAKFNDPNNLQSNAECNGYATLTITTSEGCQGSSWPEPGAHLYPLGTHVNVKANLIAGSGYAFETWTGDTSANYQSGDASVEVVMDANKTLTAVFVQPSQYPEDTFHTLTLTKEGYGRGYVEPGFGVFTYRHGQTASLHVNVNNGTQFLGWGGDLTGTAQNPTLTMDANKTVTATFDFKVFSLTIEQYGHGGIRPLPGTHHYLYGTVVPLRVIPEEAEEGWHFAGWFGGIESQELQTSVTMTESKTVIAGFMPGFGAKNPNVSFTTTKGTWTITNVCEAAEAGRSDVLYYGNKDTCTYDMGKTEGSATSVSIYLYNEGEVQCEGANDTIRPPYYLYFEYYLETEQASPNYDIATVEISKDNGKYQPLAINASVPGLVKLADPSSGWQHVFIDISQYAGSHVQYRFRFRTMDALNNAFAGFYVDNPAIIGTPECDIPPPMGFADLLMFLGLKLGKTDEAGRNEWVKTANLNIGTPNSNFMPDTAELAMLSELLNFPAFYDFFEAGVARGNDVLSVYFGNRNNLRYLLDKATDQDLSLLLCPILAAYLTLGDDNSVQFVLTTVQQLFGITLRAQDFYLSQEKFLSGAGDADNDGYLNQDEWGFVACSTDTDTDIEAYVSAALDRSLDLVQNMVDYPFPEPFSVDLNHDLQNWNTGLSDYENFSPDVFELFLLQTAVKDQCGEPGVSDIFYDNLATIHSKVENLPSPPTASAVAEQLIAAYITLGDTASFSVANDLWHNAVDSGSNLVDTDFDDGFDELESRFGACGDADGDNFVNFIEFFSLLDPYSQECWDPGIYEKICPPWMPRSDDCAPTADDVKFVGRSYADRALNGNDKPFDYFNVMTEFDQAPRTLMDDKNGPYGTENGIPDIAELALLAHVLQTPEDAQVNRLLHAQTAVFWVIMRSAVYSLLSEAQEEPAISDFDVYTAYICLGNRDSQNYGMYKLMPHYGYLFEDSEPDYIPALNAMGDPDNDGLTNLQEWQALGVTQVNETAINDYITAALTPSSAGFIMTRAIEGEGSLNPKPGTQRYKAGTSATVLAEPQEGWILDHWEVNGVEQTESRYQINVAMNADKTVTAVFAPYSSECVLPGFDAFDLNWELENQNQLTPDYPGWYVYDPIDTHGDPLIGVINGIPDGYELYALQWFLQHGQISEAYPAVYQAWLSYRCANPDDLITAAHQILHDFDLFGIRGDLDGDGVTNYAEWNYLSLFENRPGRLVQEFAEWVVSGDLTPPETGRCTPTQTISIDITTNDDLTVPSNLIWPRPGTYEYAKYKQDCVITCPSTDVDFSSCGFNSINVYAETSDDNWVFDCWTGEYPDNFNDISDPSSPEYDHDLAAQMAIQMDKDHNTTKALSMKQNRSITARYLYRPGIRDLDLVGDLSEFLVAIDEISTPSDVYSLNYDIGDYTTDAHGDIVYIANGIPDAAEFYLLQTILTNVHLNLSNAAGVTHEFVWNSFMYNLTQATADMEMFDDSFIRTVAAYMTIGNYGCTSMICSVMRDIFTIDLNPLNYNNLCEQYLSADGDSDNDGIINSEEWSNRVVDSQDSGEETMQQYAATALGPNPNPVPPGGGSGNTDCDCLNDDCSKMSEFGIWGHAGETEAKANIVSPSGCWDTRYRNTSVPMQLGRIVKLTAEEISTDMAFFDYWTSSNTLVDGSDEMSERFTHVDKENIHAKPTAEATLTIRRNKNDVVVWAFGVGKYASAVRKDEDLTNDYRLVIRGPSKALVRLSYSGLENLEKFDKTGWQCDEGGETRDTSVVVQLGASETFEPQFGFITSETWSHKVSVSGGSGHAFMSVSGGGGLFEGGASSGAVSDDYSGQSICANAHVAPDIGYQTAYYSSGGNSESEANLCYSEVKHPLDITAHLVKKPILQLNVRSSVCAGYCTANPAKKYYRAPVHHGGINLGPTIVEVTAHPRGAYRFAKWMGDGKAWIEAHAGTSGDDTWEEVLGQAYDLNEDNDATKRSKIYIKMCNDNETEPMDRTLTAVFEYVPHPIGFEPSECEISNGRNLKIKYTYSSSTGKVSDLTGGNIYEFESNSISDISADPIDLMMQLQEGTLNPTQVMFPSPFDNANPMPRVFFGMLDLPASIIDSVGFWDEHTPWYCRTYDIPGAITYIQWYIYNPPGIERSDCRCHIVVGGPYKITHKFVESESTMPHAYDRQITNKEGCALEVGYEPAPFCTVQ